MRLRWLFSNRERMNELLKFLLPVFVGATLTAIGFLMRRRITRAGHHERASLYASLADLQTKMKAAGVTFADLDALEAQLRAKVRETDAVSGVHEEPSTYWTQAEMNRRAYAALEVERAQLAALIAELEGLLDFGEREALRASQAAWVAYRDKEAEFAASEFEGGTIQPLIAASEAASLTRERIGRLQAFVTERRSR